MQQRTKMQQPVTAGKAIVPDSDPDAGLGTTESAKTVATTEAALWALVRKGDADALGRLFDRHHRAIYNYCFRHTSDWVTAEDLTSIVFLEAWRRRDVELTSGFVLAWLFGIARNVVRNRKRSERRHRAALARLPIEFRTPSFADDADARLDAERAMRAILAAAKRLPRREGEVLSLCVWSGLSYEEAVLSLGVPVGTVRSRLSRARQRLRELEPGSGHVLGESDDERSANDER
jgi:RNA polymerase sigma factor (sigma-70 family)